MLGVFQSIIGVSVGLLATRLHNGSALVMAGMMLTSTVCGIVLLWLFSHQAWKENNKREYAADEIGKVMQDMAKNMQLIVITHHAQVAVKGNSHYKVVKQDVDGKTQSNIIPLGEKERLHEIAQILSESTITDAALLFEVLRLQVTK